MTGSRPLRIVAVTPFFAWRYGGSVEVTRLLCAELARRGHDVRVLTTDLGAPQAAASAWSETDGFRVFRARAGWLHARPPYLPPRALLAAVREEVPEADVVTTHVGLTLLGAAAAKCCARHGVPFVYAGQGALDPTRLAQKRWRKALFLRTCERPLLRRVAALHALTAKEAADLCRQSAPADRIFVLHNGIDPRPLAAGDGARVRAAWGIPADGLVVLFLGRLAPEKGVELALQAALPLMHEHPRLWFVAAGPDDGRAAAIRQLAARAGVAGRVLLPGPVPPAQRADVLAAADVFAHTSLAEGLPVAVLEAAAAGLPLWITDRCNLPEVAECGAGTVDPPEIAPLYTSLRRLAGDQRVRGLCAANARRMVQEHFALPAVVDRLEGIYAGLRR